MSKASTKVVTIVTVLAIGIVGLATVAAAAMSDDGEVLHFTGQTIAFTEVPAEREPTSPPPHARASSPGERVPSVGDLFVFTSDYFDEDGEKVGQEHAQALAVNPVTFDPPGGEMLCTITIGLADGQISLVGLGDVAEMFSGEPFAVPIVGGSGAYSEARGEAIYRITGAGEFEVELHLR